MRRHSTYEDRFGMDTRLYYTVWRFTWHDGRTFDAVRPMHAGQKILWQGKAESESKALSNAGTSYAAYSVDTMALRRGRHYLNA